jgi:FKBP-type peptidyl-prolyl cis-trans isomerase 2
MRVEAGKRVRLKVKLEVAGGKVLEESVVDYVQGDGRMLPGLEKELDGLEAGARKEGKLAAAHAFGDESRMPVKKMLRREFPAEAKLATGELFAAKGPHGEDVVLRVLSHDDEHVVARFMHPLWDKDIAYQATVLLVADRNPPPLPVEAIAEIEAEPDES